jgi:hypothetical protein
MSAPQPDPSETRVPAPDPAAPGRTAGGATPDPSAIAAATPGPAVQPRKRPLIERLGLAVIALVLAALFGVVAVAAFLGGEPFLGVMGAIGTLMVLWVGGLTLFRG